MNKNLQYLSRSVLLEESGLPKINRNIILAVFAVLVLFVFWANKMIINDTVGISGEIMRDSSEYGYYVSAKVYSSDVGNLAEGMDAFISVSGITERKKIDGRVSRLVKVPQKDNYGRTYYEIRLLPVMTPEETRHFKSVLIHGMDTQVEIVIGKRNLLQYYFSRIWDAKDSSAY